MIINIKEKIGQRIEAERRELGFTLKELAELTDDLKPSRIHNWEKGIRTPGPEEIKQLAKALNVSAAYLMCLSDEKKIRQAPLPSEIGALLPLLDFQQAANFKAYIPSKEKLEVIPISCELALRIGNHAFALKMKDESMSPELKSNDFLIVDPDKLPEPGNIILAKIKRNEEVIVRRYKQLSIHKNFQEFELLPSNNNWAKIVINNEDESIMIGVVCGFFRFW